MKEKICKIGLSIGELNEILGKINAGLVERDRGAYSLNTILSFIDAYSEGKIDSIQLELWGRAYSYLFEPVITILPVSKKELLLLEIAQNVASLYRFERDKSLPLSASKKYFELLDSIGQELDKWDSYFSTSYMHYPDGEIVGVVEIELVNHKDKLHLNLNKTLRDGNELNLEGNHLGVLELNQFVAEIKDKGYTTLKRV